MGSRLRVSVVLAALLALNALFVFTLLWGVLVFVPTAVTLVWTAEGAVAGDLLRFPVSLPLSLGLTAAFLGGQLVYGYRRVLSGAVTTGREDEDLSTLVSRLAMGFDISPPAVRVVEDETPSCYTVGRVTDATVVVTTGLVEALDEAELRAVLAHELAHVANRDVTLMTVTTLFLEITERVYRAVRLPRRALADFGGLSRHERIAVQYLSVFLVAVYVLLWPVLWLFPVVAGWATRTLAHAREFAADAAAGRATGAPLALATALLTLEEASPRPGTDLRESRMHALCVVPAPVVTGPSPESVQLDGNEASTPKRAERVSAWLDGVTPAQAGATATHPPTPARVERLQGMADNLGGKR